MRDIPKGLMTTLLVFGLTTLGYGVAYLFHFSYLHFFQVSRVAIEIDISALIISVIFTGSTLMLVDYAGDIYRQFVTGLDIHNPTHRFLYSLVKTLLVIFPVILLIQYALGGINWRIILILFLQLILIVFIGPMLSVLKCRNLKKGMEEFFKAKDKEFQQSKSYVFKYVNNLFFLIGIFAIALATGRLWAGYQSSLFVIDDKGKIKSVLIQKYSDSYIAKDFDTDSKKFLPGFRIVKIENELELNNRVKVK